MPTKRQLTFGFASQVGSRLGIMVVSMISTAILARLLSPADFGITAVALSLVALADSIFEGAFAINVINRQELDSEYVSTTIICSLIFAAFLSFLVMITADIWQNIIGFPDLAVLLRVLSLTLCIKAAGTVSRNILVRDHRLHALSISAFMGAFVGNIVIACGMALAGFGIWSLVWGSIVSASIETLANLWQARPRMSLRMSRSAVREIFSTGSLYTLSQMLNWVMNSGSSMLSARALGPLDYGLYSRGNKLLELTTTAIGQPLMRVFFPSFARMKHDRAASYHMLYRALSGCSFLFAFSSAFLAVHSSLIVRVLLGTKWDQTILVGQILFLSLLPRCCYKITESAAFGLGAASLAVKRQAVFAGVALCAVAVGSHWGIIGVACGVSVGIWINYLVSLLIVVRLVDMPVKKAFLLHVPPILVGGYVAACDILAMQWSAPLGDLASHVVGLATGILAGVIVLMVTPARLISSDIVQVRRKARSVLINRACANAAR